MIQRRASLLPGKHAKDTRLFKNSALMLGIGVLLCLICRNSSTLMLIFLKKSNLMNGKNFLGVGLLNALWHGWAILDVSARIMRYSPLLKRRWLKSLIFTRLSDAYEYGF